MKGNKYNRLIKEKSPYLKEHADNLVNWYPWGREAFEKAKRENKPIFLSIGYSSCHWCHVMEEESFMDEEIAKILNENFVCILVDREERPDIDDYYMNVSYLMTGHGGWPLTIIMTPDKKPFFAATYIPKNSSFGMRGLKDILNEVIKLWENKREEIEYFAERVEESLKKGEIINEKIKNLEEEDRDKIFVKLFENLKNGFDKKNGGFGGAPKFPTPQNLFFLLRYFNLKKDTQALYMVKKTLKNMRMGGIYDQIGYGFHRYSTDPEWTVPHFEKMLYDQALLMIAYVETYQATGDEFYLDVAKEIYKFLQREMRSEENVFYAAIDADSEGKEGKFYIWDYREISNILNGDELNFLKEHFYIEKEGNFEGKIILKMKNVFSDKKEKEEWEKIRKKLLKEREKRVKPFKDYKILTDWNSMLIVSFSKLYRVTGDKSYLESSKEIYHFIKNKLLSDGKLYHEYINGESRVKGFIDDYAFFIWGLLELYNSEPDPEYIFLSKKLTDYVINNFLDKETGLFYFTEKENELPLRKKKIFEGAYPEGNSVMLSNLIKLYFITQNSNYKKIVDKAVRTLYNYIKEHPQGFTYLISNLLLFKKNYELVCVGEEREAEDIILKVNKFYNPFLSLIYIGDNRKDINKIIPDVDNYKKINNKTTFYLCKNFTCEFPENRLESILYKLK